MTRDLITAGALVLALAAYIFTRMIVMKEVGAP